MTKKQHRKIAIPAVKRDSQSASKLTTDEDFRVTLREELADRQLKNPQFSMRSFARLLDLSPSTMSEVLSGKMLLSMSTAKSIAKRLQLSSLKQELFCAQVALSRSKGETEKKTTRDKINLLRQGGKRQSLSLDQFSLIADWHHFAMLELFAIAPNLKDSKSIADRLGLRTIFVDEALARLSRLKLIQKTATGWAVTAQSNDVVGGVPSSALREYYRQLLKKAHDALANQTIEERDFSSMVFAIPKQKIAQAKSLLSGYMSDFEMKMSQHLGGDAVYCLTSQLFRLDKEV